MQDETALSQPGQLEGQLEQLQIAQAHDTQMGEPPALAEIAGALRRRQLTTTCLLMLASHRPLTFFAGQLLYALAPLAAIMGIDRVDGWAALLSAPDANARLTTMIATSPRPSPATTQRTHATTSSHSLFPPQIG